MRGLIPLFGTFSHLSLISRVFHLRRCDNEAPSLQLSLSLSPCCSISHCVYIWIHLLAFISFRFFASFLFFSFLLGPPYHYSNILPRRRARIPICSSYYVFPSFLHSFYSNGTITTTKQSTHIHTHTHALVGSLYFSGSGSVGFPFLLILCLIMSASDAQVQHFRLAGTTKKYTKSNKKPTRNQQIGGL